jgi:hypothetical protein
VVSGEDLRGRAVDHDGLDPVGKPADVVDQLVVAFLAPAAER